MNLIVDEIESSLEESVKEHKKLVYFVVKKFLKRAARVKLEFDDLVSEGMIGLIKAIRNFDSNYGVKFSTYAIPMIEGQIRRALRDANPGLKFSRNAKERAQKIDGSETVEEIIDQFQIKRIYAEETLAYKNNSFTVSMEKPISGDDDKDLTVADVVGYTEDFSNVELNDFLSIMPSKLKEISELIMKDKTQREIADEVGCSQVHVSRQIKKIRELYQDYLRGGNKEMAVITIDEYQGFKAEGLTDTQIAVKKNTSPNYLSQLKKKWNINHTKPVTVEIKPSETKTTQDDKTAEYDRLIQALRNDLKEAHTQLDEKDEVLRKYENVNAACEDVESETATLQEEKSKLQEECSRLLDKQYEDDYRVENMKQRVEYFVKKVEDFEKENKALRELVKLWS